MNATCKLASINIAGLKDKFDVASTREALRAWPDGLHLAAYAFEASAFLRWEGDLAHGARRDRTWVDLNLSRLDDRGSRVETEEDRAVRRIATMISKGFGGTADWRPRVCTE
jgi:hypothetical protein